MKKVLFLLLLQISLFACASCQMMIPITHVKIDLSIDKTNVTNLHTQWLFSDEYLTQIMTQYDKNRNKKLDKKELDTLLQLTLEYAKPKGMLTTIKYIDKDSNGTLIQPDYSNFSLFVQDKKLTMSYDAFVNIPLKQNSTLSMIYEDDEAYFDFVVTELNISGTQLEHKQDIYFYRAYLFFQDAGLDEPLHVEQEVQELNSSLPTKQNEVQTLKQNSLQSNLLQESITKIKSLFESIKDEKNPLTYLLLLLFAYLYGVIHALGPGHGKTLVSSYFLSNEKSYMKALGISVAIGFVHTFSAFLLTLFIYFILNTLLAQFVNDTVFYTTKISALIIIAIAIYLLLQKHRAYKAIQEQTLSNFSTSPHIATCNCNTCKVEKSTTDAALIISAGIIPCPGTITIFIFAISLGLYYAGFLSALIMSMGMSSVIFFSALISVMIRKKTIHSHPNIKKYLEYGSLSVILLLGIFLLLS